MANINAMIQNFYFTLWRGKLKLLSYDWLSDGQSVLLSAPIWSLWPDVCFLSDNRWFPDVESPLWREDGSVIYLYNCLWALPKQSLSGPIPAELTTIFYCLTSDSLNLEGQVLVFICPKTGRPSYPPSPLGTGFPSPSLMTCRATEEVF
jgi:hypothetical protein